MLTDVSDGERMVSPASTLRYDGSAGVRYEEEGLAFTLLADAVGEHKVAIHAGDGALIGWHDPKVKARGGSAG